MNENKNETSNKKKKFSVAFLSPWDIVAVIIQYSLLKKVERETTANEIWFLLASLKPNKNFINVMLGC